MKDEIMKLLKGNIGKYLYDVGEEILLNTQNIIHKEHTDKFWHIKSGHSKSFHRPKMQAPN